MADQPNAQPGAEHDTAEAQAPRIALEAQHITDLSFENPMAPGHFNELQQSGQSGGPNVNIEVSTGARQRMADCENASVSFSLSHSSVRATWPTLFVSPVEARFLLSRIWPGIS